jgi:hypothetical protein
MATTINSVSWVRSDVARPDMSVLAPSKQEGDFSAEFLAIMFNGAAQREF